MHSSNEFLEELELLKLFDLESSLGGLKIPLHWSNEVCSAPGLTDTFRMVLASPWSVK